MIHRPLFPKPDRANSTVLFLVFVAAALASGCTKKADPVEVVIAIEETSGTLSSATVLVDYSGAAAAPLISSGRPACASIAPNVDLEFSDDGGGSLNIEATSGKGFVGPLDVAVCRMVPEDAALTAAAIKSRLQVSLLNATRPGGGRVAAASSSSRAGSSARSDMARNEERTDRAPVAGIERNRPETGSDGYRPAMPQGEASVKSRAGSNGAAKGGQGQAADATSAYATQPFAEETVEELLERRGTGTERRAANTVLVELDQKSDALASGGGSDADDPQAQDPESPVNDPTAVSYTVTVGVTSGGGLLSALQFDVRYNGDGDWLGGAGSVVCSTHPQVALATYNNRGNGWYSAAMIDLTGFDAVGPITTCKISSRDPVDASSFSVTVIDAATPEAGPPDPFPQMAITDIRAGS